jgi:hypothetical protein
VARMRPTENAASEPPGGGRAAAAAYIAALSVDLATIARRHNLETLAYLLDMARLEAEGTAQGIGQAPTS